jgi:hypothetical protein
MATLTQLQRRMMDQNDHGKATKKTKNGTKEGRPDTYLVDQF